jgi:RNA polymerase-binding transcription factor DksA
MATRKKKAATKKATGASKASESRSTASEKDAVASTKAKKPAVKKVASKKDAAKQAAVPNGSPFSKAFLEQQKAALFDERARYTQHANFLQAEAESLAREREPGDAQFDEESGEGDSIAVERDRDLQLSAQAREAIEEIDAALARMDAGVYGICIVSGLPIPEERLEALPHADMRVEHKSRGSSWS